MNPSTDQHMDEAISGNTTGTDLSNQIVAAPLPQSRKELEQREFVGAIEAELTELSLLEPNWDAYGAPKIDPAIIHAAREFIKKLPENIIFRPRVVPMSGGNLQFEWHDGSKVLEFEFETTKTIHFLQWLPEAKIEEEATFPTADIDRAVELIHWFMSEIRCE